MRLSKSNRKIWGFYKFPLNYYFVKFYSLRIGFQPICTMMPFNVPAALRGGGCTTLPAGDKRAITHKIVCGVSAAIA